MDLYKQKKTDLIRSAFRCGCLALLCYTPNEPAAQMAAEVVVEVVETRISFMVGFLANPACKVNPSKPLATRIISLYKWRFVLLLETRVTKHEPTELLPYDKRVMHRFVAEGKIQAEDAKKYLENLPDLSDQCVDIADEIFESHSDANQA